MLYPTPLFPGGFSVFIKDAVVPIVFIDASIVFPMGFVLAVLKTENSGDLS